MFPARPVKGARVTHIPPLNVVVAVVVVGSKVTLASGTDSVKFALVIVC